MYMARCHHPWKFNTVNFSKTKARNIHDLQYQMNPWLYSCRYPCIWHWWWDPLLLLKCPSWCLLPLVSLQHGCPLSCLSLWQSRGVSPGGARLWCLPSNQEPWAGDYSSHCYLSPGGVYTRGSNIQRSCTGRWNLESRLLIMIFFFSYSHK